MRNKRKPEVGADPCHHANHGKSQTGAIVSCLPTAVTPAYTHVLERELKRLFLFVREIKVNLQITEKGAEGIGLDSPIPAFLQNPLHFHTEVTSQV